jgi:hypothetical protein
MDPKMRKALLEFAKVVTKELKAVVKTFRKVIDHSRRFKDVLWDLEPACRYWRRMVAEVKLQETFRRMMHDNRRRYQAIPEARSC